MPFGGGGGVVVLPVSIANGGTGTTTAAAALAALGGVGAGSHVSKQGTAAANYTTTSTSFTAIDSTNLNITAVVPTGSIALAIFLCTAATPGAANQRMAILVDSAVQTQILTGAGSTMNVAVTLAALLVGDGSSHTFSPAYWVDSGHTATVLNNTDGGNPNVPRHILLILPAT